MKLLDTAYAKLYDRFLDPLERRGLAAQRAQLLGGLTGEVLEVGSGTGANLAHYRDGIHLTMTEPLPQMVEQLRPRAERERPGTQVIAAPAERLPFDDASFDAVVSTLVLCSVGDLDAAVAEMRRVLRPGGQLVVIEHVRAQGRALTVQKVWEPAQKVLGRNCHMTRDTRAALERAGFDTTRVSDTDMPGAPSALFPTIVGIATPGPGS
jgi:ubiquinone/menaquinone biosynthesis C-methylase UbiE